MDDQVKWRPCLLLCSCVRHPGYLGWMLWAIGTQLVLVNPICLIAFTIIVGTSGNANRCIEIRGNVIYRLLVYRFGGRGLRLSAGMLWCDLNIGFSIFIPAFACESVGAWRILVHLFCGWFLWIAIDQCVGRSFSFGEIVGGREQSRQTWFKPTETETKFEICQ